METFIPGKNDQGRRLDRILRRFLPGLPLSRIYKALRQKDIRINGKKAQPEQRIAAGDTIEIHPSLLSGRTVPRQPASRPEAPPLPPVVYESETITVFNKPAGLAVHGKNGLDRLVQDQPARQGEEDSLSFRPGPLHRLDRNTSGLIAFSRSLRGAQIFTEKLQRGSLKKSYLALVEGPCPETAPVHWEDQITRDEKTRTSRAVRSGEEGQRAALTAEVLCRSPQASLLRVTLGTGRTHQIRVQCALRGHPLWGDRKYGASQGGGYHLHAAFLEDTEKPPLFPPLTASLPEDFLKSLKTLFSKKDIEKALGEDHN